MQPPYAMPFVIVQLVSELCNYLDNNKDTLEKVIVNNKLIVSNDKATPLYIFVFVQDKVEVVNADANRCIVAQLVKSLLSPLGASKVFP